MTQQREFVPAVCASCGDGVLRFADSSTQVRSLCRACYQRECADAAGDKPKGEP